MGNFESAFALMQGLFGFDRRDVSPNTLTKAVIREGKRSAMKWGRDQKDEVPNSYTLLVSQGDWDRFYHERAPETQDRIASLAHREFVDLEFETKGLIEVHIRPSTELEPGAFDVMSAFIAPVSKFTVEEKGADNTVKTGGSGTVRIGDDSPSKGIHSAETIVVNS